MRLVFSEQYNIPCVVYEHEENPGPTADDLIDKCERSGAILADGEGGFDLCIEFREDVGPELWSRSAIERTIYKFNTHMAG